MIPEQAAHNSLQERLRSDFDTHPAQRIQVDTRLDPKKPSPLDVQAGGSHYKNFKIQPVEFIEANNLPFLEACVIKRMCRHEAKNGMQDLEKAIHEIKLLAHLRYGVTLP